MVIINVNRGGPTGYWEVYNKEKESGITLQKIKQTIGWWRSSQKISWN